MNNILWVRLHYSGTFHRWHIVRNPNILRSPCGVDLDYPRTQSVTSTGLPQFGRACKTCASLVIPPEEVDVDE